MSKVTIKKIIKHGENKLRDKAFKAGYIGAKIKKDGKYLSIKEVIKMKKNSPTKNKATLKGIAKNLKKSSKVHAKQSKQIESIMKKSPTKLLNGGSAYANMHSRAKYKGKSKRLLKAVPNKAAFDKLSPEDKKGFTKAAKKAGLPTKNVASALKMKKSPALAKLSASCKAAAKRKFKVYPSAYANMWAAKTQRQGKC